MAGQKAFRAQLIASMSPLVCTTCLTNMQVNLGVSDDELGAAIDEQFGDFDFTEAEQKDAAE